MIVTESIIQLARKNNGVVTTAMVSDTGQPRGSLKYLADSGELERSARGVYTLPDSFEDEFVNYQAKYKRGIYSLETALFLNGLTDRTPAKFHMTFPGTYNLTNPKKDGIICHSVKGEVYELGEQNILTPGGHFVLAYDPERTLCDILKSRNNVSKDIVTSAFKQYTSSPNKNIPLLSEYAKRLGVEKSLRNYLEVLL